MAGGKRGDSSPETLHSAVVQGLLLCDPSFVRAVENVVSLRTGVLHEEAVDEHCARQGQKC